MLRGDVLFLSLFNGFATEFIVGVKGNERIVFCLVGAGSIAIRTFEK